MTQATDKNRRTEHGQTIQFDPRTAHRDRIGLVTARGTGIYTGSPVMVSAPRPLANGKMILSPQTRLRLAAGKRQTVDNAKQLAALESAVAERDRVIGESTIANVILEKMVPSFPRRQFSPGIDGRVPVQPHCPTNKGAGTAEYQQVVVVPSTCQPGGSAYSCSKKDLHPRGRGYCGPQVGGTLSDVGIFIRQPSFSNCYPRGRTTCGKPT